jgi:hypothetical protein
MRDIWTCTDPRDAYRSRTFHVYSNTSDIKNTNISIVYVLAVPKAGLDDAQVVERVVSRQTRIDARQLLAALQGELNELPDAGLDRDRVQHLRNRFQLIQRDAGKCDLVFAVHYSNRLSKKTQRERPTDKMVEIAIARIEDEGIGDRRRWHVARSLDDLPQPPHDRCTFAIVGVDSRGRIDTALPRPNHHDLDKWFGRDLRKLTQAVLQHPAMSDADHYCARNGLVRLILWRPVVRSRRAA